MPQDNAQYDRKTETGASSKDAKFLEKVLELLKTHVKKYKSNSPTKTGQLNRSASFEKEEKILRQFWMKYKNERLFSQLREHEIFFEIFKILVKQRLCSLYWKEHATPENVLRLFQCLRIMIRDRNFQDVLLECDGLPEIAKSMEFYANNHLQSYAEKIFTDILKEITNICQKLSAETNQRYQVVDHGIHKILVQLLSSTDVLILHLALYALIGLTKSEDPKAVICELNCIEILIQITEEYDTTSKQLAVTLLRQLCTNASVREQIKVFHGIPVLLSLLRNDVLKLLWNVVWILVHLAEDLDTSNEIRLLGGIPLLIALLQDRHYVIDDNKTNENQNTSSTSNVCDAPMDQKLSLKAAVCAALTELVLNDTNARHIVQDNGIFLIAILIFPDKNIRHQQVKAAEQQLQRNAFRTLRFLFSMERNRQLFKRLFPPELFETFIDVGHYKKELESYDNLLAKFNSLEVHDLMEMRERVNSINQNKAPSSYILQYAVYEHLGTGAFGSVYKVKRQGGQTFLAMKEISSHRPEFGKNIKERHDSVDNIINECSFVKKQLNHTNIVKYHKAFMDGDKLYIIMDLIDGAPLGEHFSSLKEKGKTFTEERLWNIFIQMVLALRYIHKEKFIVHRDLSPNNIMLGENDKVTITDFGLARQKNTDASKLTSMVGTILYSCPEILKGQPYGEKADIWGVGCILYQMATLEPPFYSSNMLALTTKIVEAEYEPLDEELYSPKVSVVIRRCLTVKPEHRPDILEVASLIPDILMTHLEINRQMISNLEKKLEKEKKRVQKHSDHLRNYRMMMHNQNYSESYSDDSASKTQDSIFSDNGQIENGHTDPNNRYISSAETTAYEESLVESQINENIKRQSSNPVKINKKLHFGSEIRQISDSGSNSNDEEIFAKPFAPPRKKLQPIRGRHLSSTDPSRVVQQSPPTSTRDIKRTNSCSYIDNMKSANEKTPSKLRPISAQATLSISPRKVREINDPVLQMLSQLHKILFMSQLPPSLKFDPNRRVIDQYKRSLFSAPSTAVHLKNELKKLLEGSKEQVDVNIGQLDSSSNFSSSLSNMSEHGSYGVTYEDLQGILESSLMESGYYNIPASHRTKPLGPIRSGLSSSRSSAHQK